MFLFIYVQYLLFVYFLSLLSVCTPFLRHLCIYDRGPFGGPILVHLYYLFSKLYIHYLLFIIYYSLLVTYHFYSCSFYSFLVIYHLLIIHYSLFTNKHLSYLFIIYVLSFTIYYLPSMLYSLFL